MAVTPKVITICGSSKFGKELVESIKAHTQDNDVVFNMCLIDESKNGDELRALSDSHISLYQDMLDDAHLLKICRSDELFVIDVDGYIDEVTQKYIQFAESKNIPVKYYSKDISLNKDKYIFQKLTPTRQADVAVYEDALDYVFDPINFDIQNIAVTGVYGSGKSSIIDSYEQKHHKRFIHISLAHFNGVKQDDEEIIEKKIVNQLVQQVPDSLIPDTRFKTKKEYSSKTALSHAFSVIGVLFLCLYVVKYEKITEIFPPEQFGYIPKISLLIVFALLFVLMTSILCKVFMWQKQNHVINKVVIKGNEVDIAEYNNDKSYFNRHLDEILYLLEKISTGNSDEKFDGVIIEDLDRFKGNVDAKLFEKLREICILGNARIRKNHGEINAPLRFFYLLSDGVFLSEERTKFFDYIIPIIPVVDSLNAYSRIKDGLVDAGYIDQINDSFLRGLSLYIDDFRLVKNVLNEFYIYAKKLTPTEHEFNELLAILVYKNFFPKDFAALQHRSGYVYSIFEFRSILIQKKINVFNSQIKINEEEIKKINKELLANDTELEAVKKDRENDNRAYGKKKYSDMEYGMWIDKEYPERKKYINDKANSRRGELNCKNDSLRRKIEHVHNMKLHELIDDENKFDVFELNVDGILDANDISDGSFDEYKKTIETIKAKRDAYIKILNDGHFDVMIYLINSGFLNELSYRDYMACYDENDMSIQDINFLKHVHGRNGKPFDYKIDNPKLVKENLDNNAFLLPATRNNMLIDYIISSGDEKAIESFTRQMEENDDFEFISQFIKCTSNFNAFISSLCQSWIDFLDYTIDDERLLPKEKQRIVFAALSCCSSDVIEKQNRLGTIADYIAKDIESATCDADKVQVIVDQLLDLDIKLINLDVQINDDALRNVIVENRAYALNHANLFSILQHELSCKKDDAEKRFLSSLINCNNKFVSHYVLDNLAEVLSVIYDNYDSQADYPEVIAEITNLDIDEKIVALYLNISSTEIDDIEKINQKYWRVLLIKHTIMENIDNVLKYVEKFELDEAMAEYLNKSNIEQNFDLSTKRPEFSSLWGKVYKCNLLSDSVYDAFTKDIGENVIDFSEFDLDLSKCKILIDNGLIKVDMNSLGKIRKCYGSLLYDFICSDIDGYISVVKMYMYSTEEVNNLLDIEKVDDNHKITLLKMKPSIISVRDRNLSYNVFKAVLSTYFDENDLEYLAVNYGKYGEDFRDCIYDIVLTRIPRLIGIADSLSKELLLRIFSDNRVALSNKINILQKMIVANCENGILKELMISMDEEVLSRLFVEGRTRLQPIENSIKHKQLLDLFKENQIITDYEEEKEGNIFRIKR